MKQSRLMSWLETSLSTAIGFVIALVTQLVVFPLFGFQPPLSHNLAITAIFTLVSVLRGFALRRLFEALHIRVPLPPSILAIAAERRRQIEQEGFDLSHDDSHAPGDLAAAGAMYALQPARRGGEDTNAGCNVVPLAWPWDRDWWKPQNDRRDLVRAGALIVAELDKIERNRRRRPIDLPVFLRPKARPF